MDWAGPAYSYRTEDDGRTLTVFLQRRVRVVDLLAGLFAAGFSAISVEYRFWLGAGLGTLFAGMIVVGLAREKETALAVSSEGLLWKGQWTRWERIYRFQFEAGGEYETSALRAYTLDGNVEVLTGLGVEAAEEVLALIRKRFPDIAMAESPGPSTALGRWFADTMRAWKGGRQR